MLTFLRLLLLLPAALVLGEQGSCAVAGSNESEEGLDRMELFQIDLRTQRSEGFRRRRRRRTPFTSAESFGQCVFLFTERANYRGTAWTAFSGKPEFACETYGGGSRGSLIGKVTPGCTASIAYGTNCRQSNGVLMEMDPHESRTGSVADLTHTQVRPIRSLGCSCGPPAAALAEQQAELVLGGNESAQLQLPGADEVEEEGGEESEDEGAQEVEESEDAGAQDVEEEGGEEEGGEEEESSQPEQEEGGSNGTVVQDGATEEGLLEEEEAPAENATEQLFRSGGIAQVTVDACHWVFFKNADYGGTRWQQKARRGQCLNVPQAASTRRRVKGVVSSGYALVQGGCRLVLYDDWGCPNKPGNWVRLAPLSGQFRSENTVRVHSRFAKLQSFKKYWNDRVLSAKCECQ